MSGWAKREFERIAKDREQLGSYVERTARSPERMQLYWKVLADCKRDVEAWPDFLKRAYGVKE